MTKSKVLVAAALVAALGACRTDPGKASGAPTGSNAPTAAADVAPTKAGTKPVARIVFVGQKQACECTRKRIDDTWLALQRALDGNRKLPVERLQRDVDEEKADRYDEMRSLMVAPGLYLLDEDGKLIDMLQGELSSDQLSQALARSGA